MKIVIDIPDEEYKLDKWLSDSGMGSTAISRILDGIPLPEGAEILTAEAYSDLCLRASRSVEWHPYPKEKPTKESKKYMVTTDCGEVENRWWYYTFWVRATSKVVAWAELPKPYEEGAEK